MSSENKSVMLVSTLAEMEPRRPSFFANGGLATSIRRRSGYYGHTSSDGNTPTYLPNHDTSTSTTTSNDPFATIQLTPRLTAREPSYSSMFSHVTGVSKMSRLPTPDFSPPFGSDVHALGTIRSLFNRGLSFVSIPIHPQAGFLSRASSSHSSSSRSSFYSAHSSAKSNGGDSMSISSVGTTDKFTSKWPRPRSLKYQSASFSLDSGSVQHASTSAFADEVPLGFETFGRWNRFKWLLLLSVLLLFAYSMVLLVSVMSIWFRTWALADVIYVADNDILILASISASALLITFVFGLTGVLLNSRPILAIYALLLWPSFISILVIGYVSYKRSAFALDRKLQRAWSQNYTPIGRLMIQSSLRCCGWFNSLHEAAVSNRCYARSPLPGCKAVLVVFEKAHLETIWKGIFGLVVPMHIMNIFAALLCANHVSETFGKGITPKQYRLTADDVRKDKEAIRRKLRNAGSEAPLARPTYARSRSSKVHREDRF